LEHRINLILHHFGFVLLFHQPKQRESQRKFWLWEFQHDSGQRMQLERQHCLQLDSH
jgi:hypothetical protein